MEPVVEAPRHRAVLNAASGFKPRLRTFLTKHGSFEDALQLQKHLPPSDIFAEFKLPPRGPERRQVLDALLVRAEAFMAEVKAAHNFFIRRKLLALARWRRRAFAIQHACGAWLGVWEEVRFRPGNSGFLQAKAHFHHFASQQQPPLMWAGSPS